MTQILSNLYLGNIDDALGSFILENNITAVVNISKDIPKSPYISNENFLRIAIDDEPSENIIAFIPMFMSFMNYHSNDIILIHCYAGISRSVSYVLIYLLIRYYPITFEEAYSYVKSLRPFVRINHGFHKQVLAISKDIKAKRKTVKKNAQSVYY
jgi:protein-tyrosine phosphatase